MENRNKSRQFLLRLTNEDYTKIFSLAQETNLNLTEYITKCALRKKIVRINGLDDFLKELKCNGKNLNQLTTLSNMRKIKVVDLKEVKLIYEKIYAQLLELVRCQR